MRWERSRDGGPWEPGATGHGDDVPWRFRTTVEPEADATLVLESVATDATVRVDGEPVAESRSMWLPVRVPLPAGRREVQVECRPLAEALARPRKPRARWRTRVCDNALRFHRTTLVGRAPGFAPGPPVVGLAGESRVEPGAGAPDVRLLARLDEDGTGVLTVRAPAGVTVTLEGTSVTGDGELRVQDATPWFPHTHGTPHRYPVTIGRAGETWTRHVGFRRLRSAGDVLVDGVQLHVNDVAVFVRGAVWAGVPAEARDDALQRLVAAGGNVVRLVGWGGYEPAAFHERCDELGLLVWQDLMFANLDYPFGDDDFRAGCREEVAHQLAVVAGRPSLAVVCGSSESEQQVGMLGRDPAMAREPFFTEDVPELLAAAGADAVYVPSAPSGAGRPFRPDQGVAHWFGVGGYRRPVRDVRAAGVRFAAECLAFANLPDDDEDGFVPQDVGADWDFADVRDVYVREWLGADAGDDRRRELGRGVTGELMAEVFGEWRRRGSGCGGGIVLEWRDRLPGAGWGLLDADGTPKAALGPLARALAPVAVWTTDEGQSGLRVHVANDGPEPLRDVLRVTVYRDRRKVVAEHEQPVGVGPHGAWDADVEELLGHWLDVSYAYRFGEPQHDLVVVALAGRPAAVHARFPAGADTPPLPAAELGLAATRDGDNVELRADRALRAVRLVGAEADDDGFLLEPGRPRRLRLRDAPAGPLAVTSPDLAGPLPVS